MTDNTSQTPSSMPSQGWTLLARGGTENEAISRCPGGHIHVDYGNLTVRLQRDEFLMLARMMGEAAMRLQGVMPNMADHLSASSPSVTFSLN